MLVVEVGGVARDEGIHLEGRIEAFDEKSLFERPILWLLLVVDVPVFGDNLVADDARVADEGADADAFECGQGVAQSDVGTHLFITVAARRKQQ